MTITLYTEGGAPVVAGFQRKVLLRASAVHGCLDLGKGMIGSSVTCACYRRRRQRDRIGPRVIIAAGARVALHGRHTALTALTITR